MDVIQHMGLIGGAIGAIRGIKDLIGNKKFDLSGEVASRLFQDKLIVWCKKSDAIIWRYNEKPWLLIKSSSEQLFCPFVSQAGVLNSFFVLWCTARSLGQSKGNISELGCEIRVVAQNLPEKDVHKAMLASRINLVACE